MRNRSLLLVLMLSLCATSLLAAGRRRAVRSPSKPEGPCAARGAANLFYSTDGGGTWSRNAETRTKAGAWDLVVIPGTPETILAVLGRNVLASTDGGCNWTAQYSVAEDIHHTLHLVGATEGRAYIWWEEVAFRYDRGVVTRLPIPEAIGGLGVDPGNREHVRVLDLDDGRMRESFDGGTSWSELGISPGGRINSAAFDPSDFNHILAGVQTQGIQITRDGGRSWTSGFRTGTVCNMAFAASQPNVLWATLPSGPGAPVIYRSTDAGTRLEAIAAIDGVPNRVCLAFIPNPHNANQAYVLFNDAFLVDAAQKSVTQWNCCGGRTSRIAWDPNDASQVFAYEGER